MDVEVDVVEDDKSEGEISSDDDIISAYVPLERPDFLHAQKVSASKIDDYCSDEANDSPLNESDSDSDSNTFRSKKAKVKPRYKRPMHRSQKPNKYNIWSNRAQEDFLAENLITCDVANVDRSRDVETYDVPARIRNKRTFADRSNVHLRLGKREPLNDDDDEEKKGAPRTLLDLVVTLENTDDEVATDISNKLYEEKDDLLKRIVNISGKEKAMKLFNETKSIEADGGMLIMNQTRRRTPGGVYFFLVKRDDELSEDQKRDIFQEERRTKKEKKASLRRKAHKERKSSNHLPNLLSRAEIELAKGNKSRRDSNDRIEEHVSNPPPSPVTDGKEASSDEMADVVVEVNHPAPSSTRNASRSIQSYEDDFLEIGCESDIDVFT